jgi:hypothetical protein
MKAEWKSVSIKDGAYEEKNFWYLFITPMSGLNLSGDFKCNLKIDGGYSFYFWLNVAAIMWNKDL